MLHYDKILIASAKGGVGKSTTAVGLALAFAEIGKRVLLVDCDAYSRSLDLLCGGDSPLYNLGDVILGRVRASDAIVKVDTASAELSSGARGNKTAGSSMELYLCTAPHLFQDEEMFEKEGRHINELMGVGVRQLLCESDHDIVIIDTSSGGGLACAAELADDITAAIVTSEQSKTSVRAAEYTASQLGKIGISDQRLVVCGFDVDAAIKGDRSGVVEMIDGSTLKCVGVVPYDRRLILRQESGKLPDRRCVSSQAYRNIAERLAGQSVPVFSGMRRYERKRSRVL